MVVTFESKKKKKTLIFLQPNFWNLQLSLDFQKVLFETWD
jgi:hypothetical protein